MKEIICETSSCEHNLKCRCMAGIISVGDGAKCLSRIKREGGALAQSFADVEAGEEFHGADRDSIVQCSAECALNTGGLCSAEKITVRDKLFSAKCKSELKILRRAPRRPPFCRVSDALSRKPLS